MEQIDPEDSQYVCTLTPQSLARAARELFEDPKQRLGAVQTLRRWIKEQPHITCRTDNDFLLQVLRTAKFSQLRAREIIETILTMMTKHPQLMCNIDSHDPVVLDALDRGVLVTLPKPDHEGRFIHILRPGEMNLNDTRFTVAKEMRFLRTLELLLKENNENMIVNGELMVGDMTGFTTKHIARMTFSNNKDHFQIMQECNLGRLKGIHFYNGGVFFEAVMAIIRPFLKQKYLDRIHVHSTMESLYQAIPMELWPDEYLPDDYTGPSAGPIKTLVADVKQRMLDPLFRSRLLDHSSDRYKIDLKAKPVDVPQASFRKLNTD